MSTEETPRLTAAEALEEWLNSYVFNTEVSRDTPRMNRVRDLVGRLQHEITIL